MKSTDGIANDEKLRGFYDSNNTIETISSID